MRVSLTFTGTGTTFGVPVIGCDCPVCTSRNPRNRRLRSGALFRWTDRVVAVDTSPDFREQMLAAGETQLDAVLYTHEHADHIHGIDDLRRFNQLTRQAIPAYAPPACARALWERFSYATSRPGSEAAADGAVSPRLNILVPDGPFDLFGVKVTPIELHHAGLDTLGWRVGSIAYLTDLKLLPERSKEIVRGVEVLAIDALRPKEHPTHLSIDEALALIEELSPRVSYLTHMTHDVDYCSFESKLPEGVHLAYDGLTVEAT